MPISPEQNHPSLQENTYLLQTRGESLAQVYEAVDTFLADAEVGTVKFAAFSDFVTYRDLYYRELNEAQSEVNRFSQGQDGIHEETEFHGKTMIYEVSEPERKKVLLSWESQMRELEVTIGAFRSHILVEKGRTPGYAVAYNQSDLFRERLERAYSDTDKKDNVLRAHIDLTERRNAILAQAPPDLW